MSRRFSKAILIAVVMCMLSVMVVVLASGNASNDDSQINQLIQMSKAGKSTDKIIETAQKNGFLINYMKDYDLEGKEIWESFVSNCEAGIPGSVKILAVRREWYDESIIGLAIIEYVYADGKYTKVSYELPSGKSSESDQCSRLVSYYSEEHDCMHYFITNSDIDVDSFESEKEFERAVYDDELPLFWSLSYKN